MASRGRPKNAETLELERIEAMFKNRPAHIKPLTKQERKKIETQLAASKKIEEELIADYGPTIPHRLIFELASLGDESMFGHEDKVIGRYDKLIAAEKSGQLNGARVTAQKAHGRAKAFWDKNPDLFEAMGRPRNANTTAQRIIDNWSSRGDGGEVPSINTIKNWYKLIQNSKGSSSKK